ncbi:MAG TPA: protein kinase [Pyrinomonadaceae bacterium]|jgi:serine/threonine protein kinase
MSPERLKKVEEVFHAALELAPGSRESFVRESCGGDNELRAEVESLLAFENGHYSVIDTPPDKIAAALVNEREAGEIAGSFINQYKILSILGKGGMGTVYLAEDTRLERRVAIKMLAGDLANDATRLERFFQEARAASALNHPNILTVHEIGETGGTHFIVTEFIKGRTLQHYLAEEKPTVAGVLEIAAQIGSALSGAHASGIIHRDIKPDNIMVRRDGIVKVLDFGIAKLSDAAGTAEIDGEAATRIRATMTTPGMLIGTPQYMSPEQARAQKVDFRTDIFSFGVVLYEMLAGRPPFSGATQMDIIGAILKDEPPPLSQYLPEISHALEHIVAKTLRKDREQRYQHIEDLLIDLNDAKKTLEFSPRRIHQTEISNAPVTAETGSKLSRQSRFSLAQVLFFLLIAAGLTGLAGWFTAKPLSTGAPAETPPKTAEIISWASTPGEYYSVGSFSPDGKMIAFASTKTGGRNIWIKQTATGEAIQITKDEFSNEQPIWSPGGEELAFFSTRGNQTGVWRIPLLGGAPKFIAIVEDGSSILRLWSKTGLIYYESNNDIYAIDVNSGQTRQITELDSKLIKAESISISPDEQNVSYTTIDDDKWSIWTKPIAGGEPKKLFTGGSEIKNTAWHTDNRRIFYSRLVDGGFQIFVTDINAAPPKQITFGEKDAFVLDVAPDGARILYGSAKEESDIWSVNVKDSKETAVASDIDSELWAAVAPDGKSIAYQSIKNLSQGNNLFNGRVLIKKLNSDEQPTEISAEGYLPVWSADGALLAFMEISGNKNRIATVRVAGGQKQTAAGDVVAINNSLLPYNHIQTSDYSWSPDSRQIAYVSKTSGQSNLWITGADGTNNFQLTANADAKLYFYCPLWSPDGKSIAFTTRTGNSGKQTYSAWVIDTETKTTGLLTQQKTFFRLLGWEQGGAKLFLVSTEGSETSSLHGEVSIRQLETETGKIQTLAGLKDVYLANIQLAPDRKAFAFAAHREGKDNIWLVSTTAGGTERKLTGNNDSRLYFSSLSWSPDSGSIYFGKQTRYSLLSMLTNFK